MKFLTRNSPEEDELLSRFIKYVKTFSTSDSKNADKGVIPSTECQRDFALMLSEELKGLGFDGVQVTENSYVYGFIPATEGMEKEPPFCLLAHMDTVEEVSGKDVNPQIVKNYSGQVLKLKNNFVLDPEEIPLLKEAGKNSETIITTDGTTLLGGDDKAGLSAIVTALSYLLKHPELRHGKVEVIFSPDEETGHGMDKVPLNLLESRYAYTVDGGTKGELEYECFNAFKSVVKFTGRASHTGTARASRMVNAITAVSQFVQNLPRNEAPETTDGYDGFYAPMEISGNMEIAEVVLFLRDFDRASMDKRLAVVEKLAESTAAGFGAKVEVKHTQQYLNMREVIEKNSFVKEKLVKAYEASGVDVKFNPIRGGTDGSRLSEMGIPTPNIFTGAHNYHSQLEWVSLDQMLCAADVLINLSIISKEK